MKVSPYHFCIENITDDKKNAVLFNSNANALAINYGSDVGINITAFDRSTSYLNLLYQSAQQPFKTKMFRFIMDSWENMPRELIYSYKYVTDHVYRHERISLVSQKIDSRQRLYQDEISKDINGWNYITIEVAPKSIMHLVIFT